MQMLWKRVVCYEALVRKIDASGKRHAGGVFGSGVARSHLGTPQACPNQTPAKPGELLRYKMYRCRNLLSVYRFTRLSYNEEG